MKSLLLTLITLVASWPVTAQTPPTPPAGFTYCADEGKVCTFTGARRVAYGKAPTFIYKTLTGGTLCTNAVFTDPLPQVPKACFVENLPPPPPAAYTIGFFPATGQHPPLVTTVPVTSSSFPTVACNLTPPASMPVLVSASVSGAVSLLAEWADAAQPTKVCQGPTLTVQLPLCVKDPCPLYAAYVKAPSDTAWGFSFAPLIQTTAPPRPASALDGYGLVAIDTDPDTTLALLTVAPGVRIISVTSVLFNGTKPGYLVTTQIK